MTGKACLPDNGSVVENENEARFLENQRARTAALAKGNSRRKEMLSNFWAEVRGQLVQWRNRLSQRQSLPSRRASDRQQAMKDLDRMLDEMRLLQKNALGVDLELTVTDLKLLHDEFAKCRKQLEEAREFLCPSSRFTFKRYRSALKERGVSDVEGEKKLFVERKKKNFQPGRSIQNLSDVLIYENIDGTVRIESDGETKRIQKDVLDSTSLVVQNLFNCEIFINIKYHLVHIIDVKHSKINFGNRIEGAIHITDCNETTINGSSHQLRIHESAGLQFHFKVDTAPILEDSTDICFFANSRDTTLCQAKDFDWFRTDKPSPNFRVEVILELIQPNNINKGQSHSEGNNKSKLQISAGTCQTSEEESDEDEI